MTQSTELRELASVLSVDSSDATISRRTGVSIDDATEYSSIESSELNPVGTDALYLYNTESTSTNGKVSILMRSTGGGGGASARITLKNDRSGGGSLRFLFRDQGHTTDAKEKFAFTSDGKLGVGLIGLSNINNPQAPIHVGTDSIVSTDSTVLIEAPIYPSLEFDSQNTNTSNRRWKFSSVYNTYGTFEILRGASAGAAPNVTTLSLTNDGYVAIGPSHIANYVLDVQGDIHTTTTFRADEVRHSIAPSLNLDFANSKQLDSRITFYRDSIATYYDSKGILRYANHNEPRFDHDHVTGESKGLLIEEARENIAQATNLELPYDFNNMHVEGSKYYEIAPDGTYSGHRVIASPGVSRHEVNIKYPGTSGVVYTGSVWVKPLGAVTHFNVSRAGGSDLVRFVLTGNGSVDGQGGSATGTITKCNNGWYKISITFTEATTGAARAIYMSPGSQAGSSSVYNNLTGDGINGVALWGSQVEEGAFVTSYVPLNTRFTSRSSEATYHDEYGVLQTAPANSARHGYKYDGRKWIETGFILEKTSTNLFTESNLFEGGSWSTGRQNISISKDSTGNPDGNTNTRFMTASSEAGAWILKNVSLSSGTFYTTSVYAKQKSSGINVQIAPSTAFSTTYQNFNLSTGELGSGDLSNDQRATMEDVGNGWYRCSVTGESTSTLGRMAIAMVNGDNARLSTVPNGSMLYIFGAQMEANRGPTSFIYTESTSETRSADVMTSSAYTRAVDEVVMYKLNDFYNEDEGTLYAEHNVDRDITSGAYGVVQFNDTTTDNYIGIRYRSSGNSGEIVTDDSGGAISAQTKTGADLDYFPKSVIAYKENDFAGLTSGGTLATDTSGQVPYVTQLQIGKGEGINTINGHIKKITYYPLKLSSAEIQALTENN